MIRKEIESDSRKTQRQHQQPDTHITPPARAQSQNTGFGVRGDGHVAGMAGQSAGKENNSRNVKQQPIPQRLAAEEELS
ncbi:MAG: hypothetical protein DYG89_54925 [Caldilinea sp. CFX5]|nr:hypothetical protein [Caldilinea sp. CFX5]